MKNITNKSFLLGLIFILSIGGCSEKQSSYTTETTEFKDPIEELINKNQEDLAKIKEYDLKTQDEELWKGEITDKDPVLQQKGLKHEKAPEGTTPKTSKVDKQTKADYNENYKDKVIVQKYYDSDTKSWGDAYYYTLVDKYGRDKSVYAYSMINGEQKVVKLLQGSNSRVLRVPSDVEIPDDVRKWIKDNKIVVSNIDEGAIFEDPNDEFSDPYEEYASFKEGPEVERQIKEVTEYREYYLKQELPKLVVNDNYISNLKRKVEGNENANILDKASLKTLSLVNKYSKDEIIREKAKSDKEIEEAEWVNNSTVMLDTNFAPMYSSIGYESDLVVLKIGGVNKVLERASAFLAAREVYEEKANIVREAETMSDLALATAISVQCPQAREFTLRKYLVELNKQYQEIFLKKSDEIRLREKG